jgi:N-glycosylase/DNA lyase
MQKLVSEVMRLKKTPVRKTIDARIKEFRGKHSGAEVFSELCFCLMTANFSAEMAIKIQNSLKEEFHSLPEKQLASALRKHGHRFPNARAKYVCEARINKNQLMKELKNKNGKQVRGWLEKNVKGLGYKEASHFLRNIGYSDVAIIDFHIIDLLARRGIIKKPKSLTKKKYLEIERALEKLAAKTGLSLAELDLYLWFLETGKVLK